jgi:hypothetical protein
MGPQLSKLGLHSLQMHPEDFSDGPAHLLSMPGDDLSDLHFHRLGSTRRFHTLTLRAGAETRLLLGAANGAISPGFGAFPDLPRIPADVSFGRSSFSFRPRCGCARVSPDVSWRHNPSLAFGALIGAVARPPGLHPPEPVVPVLAYKGDLDGLALPQLAGRHPEIFVLSRNQDRHVVVTLERLDHNAQVALLIDLLFDKPDKGPAHLAYPAAFLSGQGPAEHQRRHRDEQERFA